MASSWLGTWTVKQNYLTLIFEKENRLEISDQLSGQLLNKIYFFWCLSSQQLRWTINYNLWYKLVLKCILPFHLLLYINVKYFLNQWKMSFLSSILQRNFQLSLTNQGSLKSGIFGGQRSPEYPLEISIWKMDISMKA